MEEEPTTDSGIRKRIVNQTRERMVEVPTWLPIEKLAQVEVTSEDPDHPIDHALLSQHPKGWMASEPGAQTIRLLFDQPQTIHRIYLHFEDSERERTQEIVLRWSTGPSGPSEEIVRQQWNFSPTGSTHEIEDYRLESKKIARLELEITPDRSGGDARASLQQFYVA